MAHGVGLVSIEGLKSPHQGNVQYLKKAEDGKDTNVTRRKPTTIRATEFSCQTPLKFYEHCASCPRFEGCPDLDLIKEILRMQKSVNYNRDLYSARGELEGIRHSVDANVFNCLAPLYFFEKVEKNAHMKDIAAKKACFWPCSGERRNWFTTTECPSNFPVRNRVSN